VITQIVDYTAEVHVAYEVDVVVSPLCRAPPPTPHVEAWAVLGELFRDLYGVGVAEYLADQAALGLERVDPVLLFAQLPLGVMHTARLMPYGHDTAQCTSAWPDPATAAVAVVSNGASSIAVDLRLWQGDPRPLLRYAAAKGAKTQLILTKPLDLPGDVVFHSSVPPYARERYVRAPGDLSATGRTVTLKAVAPTDRSHEEQSHAFKEALARVAEVLDLGEEVFADLVEQGVVSHGFLLDLAQPSQLAYLVKWGLVERVAGGWGASAKLIYLYGLLRG